MVDYRRLNLIEPFDPQGMFPLISCRNVMIYFDRPTQERVVNRLAQFLEPGGHLFIGHSESLNGIHHPLEFVKPAIYRKPQLGGPKL
jgi:chemotaxis protein methyltransferase CheR